MTERNASRPWTEEEDKLLQQGVERYGEQENWKTIALSIPGRTNKACRKRWLHSLSPKVKKTAWTAEEDQKLLDLYEQQGPKWSAIARQIPGRTDDACSKRYREALDPSLKKDVWTPEEDRKLDQAHVQYGMKWGLIGQELQRSGLACRNRWRLIERKRAARAALILEDPGLQNLGIVTHQPHCPLTSLEPVPRQHPRPNCTFPVPSPPPGSPAPENLPISPHATSSLNLAWCDPTLRPLFEKQTATLYDHWLSHPQAHTSSHCPGTLNIFNDAQHSLTDFIVNQQDLRPLLSAIFGQPSPSEGTNENFSLPDSATTRASTRDNTAAGRPDTDTEEIDSARLRQSQNFTPGVVLMDDGTTGNSEDFNPATAASMDQPQADMIAIDATIVCQPKAGDIVTHAAAVIQNFEPKSIATNATTTNGHEDFLTETTMTDTSTINGLQDFDLGNPSGDTVTSNDPLSFNLGTLLAHTMADVYALEFHSGTLTTDIATDEPLDFDRGIRPFSSDFATEHSRDFTFEALLENITTSNPGPVPASPHRPSNLPFLFHSLLPEPQSDRTRADLLQFLQPDSLQFGPVPLDVMQFNSLRTNSLQVDMWKSSNFIVPSLSGEASIPEPDFITSLDDPSSTQSTPLAASSPMSPFSSPDSLGPADLPNEQSPGSPLHLQNSARPSPSSSRRRHPCKARGPNAASRLSSSLPLSSDPNVRPYACGREDCWPVGALASISFFATSKELFEHSKEDHEGEPLGDKPFRCGLPGCGKSWKSINGLQYHLQLSAAHFRNALSSQFSAQGARDNPQVDSIVLAPDNSNRAYACPVPNCFKAYRQHSGLRYHVLHGHPEHMPVQLPLVPPALARQLPTKARKMRHKQTS